jgi:hypothetical protein
MPRGDSVLAERLLRVLTDSSPEADPVSREQPDISRLTDEELGTLIPAAYQVPITGADPASLVRMAVEDAVRERQPRFAPESCARMFAALVAGLRARQWADLTPGGGGQTVAEWHAVQQSFAAYRRAHREDDVRMGRWSPGLSIPIAMHQIRWARWAEVVSSRAIDPVAPGAAAEATGHVGRAASRPGTPPPPPQPTRCPRAGARRR